MATSVFRRDHLLRRLTTPASVSTDYTGRATTATADHLGRNLVAIDWPGAVAVSLGQLIDVAASRIVYQCTVAGTAGAAAPTAPGVGNTVVSGTATLLQLTNG
jgi:hypothetical protein